MALVRMPPDLLALGPQAVLPIVLVVVAVLAVPAVAALVAVRFLRATQRR